MVEVLALVLVLILFLGPVLETVLLHVVVLPT